MSKKDEALKLALGELQAGKVGIAMQILREALAEQPVQQEPVKSGEGASATVTITLPAQQALDKKAENARELGLDYEPVWNNLPSNKDVEDAMRLKRLSQLAEHPAQRTWVGLTEEDENKLLEAVIGSLPIAKNLIRAIEEELREKNT